MLSLLCFKNNESSENSKTTLEKGGRNPPDVKLDFVLENLLKYLSTCETKKDIEKKYNIDKEHDDCWSENDIKRAWGKTQRMDDDTRRNLWALVIVMQVLKRQGTKEEESKERSAQSSDEPETVEAAGGGKQMSGADSGGTKYNWIDNTGSESLPTTSGERDDSEEVPKRRSLTRNDDGSWAREGSNTSNSQTVYIRIPFSVMSGNESPSSTDTVVQNDSPTYKLIDGVPNLTEIRKRKSYALLYDNRTKNAAWVYEILNSETLKQEVERQNVFSVDQSIHPFYQASKDLYQPPYVRGHLAAAANHRWCQKALEDTFLMSNISPQHKDLNNGSWKSLEQEYHKKAKDDKNKIRNVHVYSGPLYLPRDRVVKYEEMRGQAVPTHFFKVIIVEHCDGTVKLECYQMPNEKSEYRTVTIEDIERASGLIFRENSCSKGETDSDREITWTGENEYGETCTVKTLVKISTPCS